MKRLAQILLPLMMLLALCAVLIGCADDDYAKGIVDFKIIIGEEEFAFEDYDLADGSHLDDALKVLIKEGKVTMTESNGMILSINTLNPDSAKREFIAIYTSVKKDAWFYPGVSAIKYNYTDMYSAGYGKNQLPLRDDMLILFKIATY